MVMVSTTDGRIIITIDQCSCGLTGGCEKCRPIILLKPQNYDDRLTLKPSITFTPSSVNPFLYDLTQKGLEDIKQGRVHKIPHIK